MNRCVELTSASLTQTHSKVRFRDLVKKTESDSVGQCSFQGVSQVNARSVQSSSRDQGKAEERGNQVKAHNLYTMRQGAQ